jgi:hypothetical protein
MITATHRREMLTLFLAVLLAVSCTSSDPCRGGASAGQGGQGSGLGGSAGSDPAEDAGRIGLEVCPVPPLPLSYDVLIRYRWYKPTSCRFDLFFLEGSVTMWGGMWSDSWVTVLIDCVEVRQREPPPQPGAVGGAGGASAVSGLGRGGGAGDVARPVAGPGPGVAGAPTAGGTAGKSGGGSTGIGGGLEDSLPGYNWRNDDRGDPQALEILGRYCDQILAGGVEYLELIVRAPPEP